MTLEKFCLDALKRIQPASFRHSRMLRLHQASTSNAMADRERPRSRKQKSYHGNNVLRNPRLLRSRYTCQFSRGPRNRCSYGGSDDLLLCRHSLFLSSGISWCESLRRFTVPETTLIFWWYCSYSLAQSRLNI